MSYGTKMSRSCIFWLIIFFSTASICDIHAVKNANARKSRDAQASDMNLTPLKLVRKYGYPSEAHLVKSQDGYILELHRIPHGKSGLGDKKRIPILIHHGILSSSIDWIVNGPDKSLGYRLADEGYDVWLANARGNTFSRSHITYSSQEKEFWDYSFHEMGFYDLPASIDHILNVTGEEQLIYIGHSMGTTVFFVMASTQPEYSKKIKFQISLAPVTAITHTTSAYRSLVPGAKAFINLLNWYDQGAFLENDMKIILLKRFYNGDPNILYSFYGKDTEQFNNNLVPIISKNFPAGTSGKNLIHCSQLISSGTFSQYDYGEVENIKRYGTKKPPKYNINKISVPIRLYYGENDFISNPTDTKILYQKISKPLGLQRINYDKFNHVDFLWAKDINKLLNDEIIQFIHNSTNNVTGFNFIQDSIARAIDEKIKNPARIDVTFDQKKFLNNVDKDIRESPLSFLSIPGNTGNKIRRTVQQKINVPFLLNRNLQ